MRLLDMFANARRQNREGAELAEIMSRLARFRGETAEERNTLCHKVLSGALARSPHTAGTPIREAVWGLLQNILSYEGIYTVTLPGIGSKWDSAPGALWEEIAQAKRELANFEDQQRAAAMTQILTALVLIATPEHGPPVADEEGGPSLSAPLSALFPRPDHTIENMLGIFLGHPNGKDAFPKLWKQLEWNVLTASGINPAKKSSKEVVLPTKAKDKAAGELIEEYLGQTPFAEYFSSQVPFSILLSSRFEHTHIVGGSGHGKTQLLQSMQLRDIDLLLQGKGSIIVIDSQGDMIRTMLGLKDLAALSDRIVLIDPNDIEHPPCLNLFDFGLDRLGRYSAADREKLINGAIALYEYMFGALLGADLTQRQGVIFRYLARLLMVVPGATIHTLREFMEEPETTREYFGKLDPTSRIFFETQFFSRVYDDTRQQILTRLWGVISNSVLARMFSNTENKVDVFSAMNKGSLILINTAKDLLKQDGCEILGRFFIALIAQATQERAAIAEKERRATFLYIDEAQDYFDQGIEQLLNQARKYKVGLVLAHQNLGQFEPRLQAAVMASTAIKLAGGVSAKDAAALAREMRCEPELLLEMRKHEAYTDFACFVKNVMPSPIQLSIPFGQMEKRPRMSAEELAGLLAKNRERYAAAAVDGVGAGLQSAPSRQPARKVTKGEIL
jgi:hypothetical protein